MVDVEHGPLPTLEEHSTACGQGAVEKCARIGDHWGQTIAIALALTADLVIIEHVLLENGTQVGVLLFHGAAQNIWKDSIVEQLGEADSHARHLIFVRGSDSASGGPDPAGTA